MTGLTAGSAAVVITPPVGTPMDGYWPREGPAQGVHDDLYARALVIDDGEAPVALVSCDLLAIDRRFAGEARRRAHEATGIPPERILIAATHTHASPAGLRFPPDAPLLEVTARHIAGVIDAANRARRPAVMKVGATAVDSVSMNRRDPEWPIDPSLYVLLFDDPDPLQPPVAAMINFACHPTVLYGTNLLFSADYPGHAVRAVRELFPGLETLFFNGSCGDVNPAFIAQEFEEAERVGVIVGAAAARLIGELRPLGPGQRAHNIRWSELIEKPVTAGELVLDVRLRGVTRDVELPARTYLPDGEYETTLRDLDARVEATADIGVRRETMAQINRLRTERELAGYQSRRPDRPLRGEVMAVSFAPGVVLLGLPGEFFVETVADIRQRAGLRYLPVACYANNYVGYVVPPHSFDDGGYEPGIAFAGPEAESIVKAEALSLLAEVSR